MENKGSSLSELREAGAARQIVRAQAATRQALTEVRKTTSALRGKIDEARSHGLPARRSFIVDRTMPRLPRAVPLWG